MKLYACLAGRGEHLLTGLVADNPKQWSRYPEDDAIDLENGFQWFYHAHSPEERQSAMEHGHIHLFARKPVWSRRMRSKAERNFAELCGFPVQQPATRHLLGIGFDAKGLPINIFMVNSWVTGDLMLSASLTLALLGQLQLNTGFPKIDTVIESVATLCANEIDELLRQRDGALRSSSSGNVLADERLEILSECRIDLDAKLRANR